MQRLRFELLHTFHNVVDFRKYRRALVNDLGEGNGDLLLNYIARTARVGHKSALHESCVGGGGAEGTAVLFKHKLGIGIKNVTVAAHIFGEACNVLCLAHGRAYISDLGKLVFIFVAVEIVVSNRDVVYSAVSEQIIYFLTLVDGGESAGCVVGISDEGFLTEPRRRRFRNRIWWCRRRFCSFRRKFCL